MPYTPILATLGYVFSPDGRRVLMIHRNARPGRPAPRQVQRPGRQARPRRGRGRRAAPRDPRGGRHRVRRAAARRHDLLAGVRQARRGLVRVHLPRHAVHRHAARPQTRKGRWNGSRSSGFASLPLWDGDRHFLPLVFDRQVPQFHGVMPYRERQAGELDRSALIPPIALSLKHGPQSSGQRQSRAGSQLRVRSVC